MAVSVTKSIISPPIAVGPLWMASALITLDNSYAEGGEALTLQQLGFGLEAVHLVSIADIQNLSEQGTFRPSEAKYDGAKIKVVDSVTGKELAKEKDLSKVTVQIIAFCTSN